MIVGKINNLLIVDTDKENNIFIDTIFYLDYIL